MGIEIHLPPALQRAAPRALPPAPGSGFRGTQPRHARFVHRPERGQVEVHELYGRRQAERVALLVQGVEASLYLPDGRCRHRPGRHRHLHGVLLASVAHVGKPLEHEA